MKTDVLGIIDSMSDSNFLVIIEDHPLYKQALVSLMKLSFPDQEVLGFSTSEEAIEFLSKQSTSRLSGSLALMDLTLPGLSGIELINKTAQLFPDLQLAVISGSEDKFIVGTCLGAGVRAFISKNTAPDRIVDLIGRALRRGLADQTWINANGVQNLKEVPKIKLTSRQLAVLRLVCRGYTNKQIADHLETVEATAKAHVSAILRELDVENRTQAVLIAQNLGLE